MNEHHTQRLDFGENGYLEATRDDTEDLQDFHLKAFMPDGKLVREIRILYNIQYDYKRRQEWKNGVLIEDDILPGHGYGHLQWENSVGGMGPDWDNPYPDNYEPVKKEGCDMFHWEGYKSPASLYENKVKAEMNCYILKDLEAARKPANLLTDAHVVTMWREVEFLEKYFASECERLAKNPFNPELARKKRLEFLESYGKVIGVTIPYDQRFIDGGGMMVKAIDVANFFIDLMKNEDEKGMTNLRIQKLLYFAQVHSLARFGRPLFSEDIEAWKHGPVIREVYFAFPTKGKRITDVSEDYSPDVFSDEEIALLQDVEQKYRQYSTWDLSEITHRDGPWKETQSDSVISNESLKEYASQIDAERSFSPPKR